MTPLRPARAGHALAVLICLGLLGCGCGATDPAGASSANNGASGLTASGAPSLSPAGGQSPNPSAPAHAPAIAGDRLASAAVMPANPNTPQEPSPFRFAEIAKEAGIDFVQFSGMNADKHFPTANGSGAAIFDYDGDGKMDIYFATCTLLPLGTAQKGPNRLYKNLGGGKFQDVTQASGLGFRGFCHGIVVGDIDNDGDQDVFLCNYGPNVLYLNNGDGTFKDISKSAGIDAPNWSSGGAFLDYDDDGDLDLYVSNYGTWKLPDNDVYCGDKEKGVRFYCSPRTITPVPHLFYRNNGDHTFTEVSAEVGLKREKGSEGRGFGVVTADLNGDGKIDIYVANDMNANFLFLNKGNGTFEDATEGSGAAYDEKGQAQSGMGADAEDFNGDGRPDLFVTNFQNEYNTLYENLGNGIFYDTTAFVGLAADSLPWVGWGCALADFDNDGWPDSFVADGHVDDNRRLLGQPVDYDEPPLLHRNVALENKTVGPDGKPVAASRRFRLSTRDVGPYFSSRHVARGAAFGDLDDDGDLDIVVNHKDTAPAVLRNDTPGDNRWIRLELVGTKSNRDAVGARVEVETGERTIYRQRKGGCSLESAHDPRLLIGVGPVPELAKVTVRWPSGVVTVREHVATNKSYRIVEGEANP